MDVPNEVWMFGKGPSLDYVDWSKIGPCRIGLNEVAFVVPDCWGAFATDYPVLDKFKESLSHDVCVFRKNTHNQYIFPKMFTYSCIWVKSWQGIGNIATQVLHALGARTFHYIGFDSLIKRDTGYAQVIKNINGEGENTNDYKDINGHFLATIKRLDINAIIGE